MEFHEKLQALRKGRGLTQEELAQVLYVSRTAISKWESGRGYPSIDSLKEISCYFSVTIDDLLSGEKLLSIAEREKHAAMRNLCALLFGVVDVLSVLLIVLPLYPNTVNGYVYPVNLLAYTETTPFKLTVCWVMCLALVVLGAVELLLTKYKAEGRYKTVLWTSMALHCCGVLFLAVAREAYAGSLAFLLFVIKGALLFKCAKTGV